MSTEFKSGASAEDRQKIRDSVRDEQVERDTETLINTTPTPITAVDALGIERIITTVDGTYTAAQTDPDPKEVKRLANLAKRLDNKKSERLAQMTGTPDSEGGKVAAAAIKAEGSSSSSSTNKSA